jgi:hypothetical protein
MDDNRRTELAPEDFARVEAELDQPAEPNERLQRAARNWREVRPQVVTDEARVAEHRAKLDADYERLAASRGPEDAAYTRAMRARKRDSAED